VEKSGLLYLFSHFISWLHIDLVLCRYSDRVKEETERLDSLDLEDLEVPF